jgi:WD40 repeat protein
MQTRANWRRTGWHSWFAGVILALIGPRTVLAQVAPAGFFSDPILVLRVNGHQGPVRSMVFTPGGTQLLTGGMDKVVQVWNLDADRSGPSRTLRPPLWRGSRGKINAMALSPRDEGGNQRLLAVAGFGVLSKNGEILLFRYPGPNPQGTGDVQAQLSASGPNSEIHQNAVTSLAFTPDGKYLISCSTDKTARVWDISTKRQVAVLEEATAGLNVLAVTSNGRKLATGGEDGILRLYDLANPTRPALANLAPPAVPGLLPGLSVITSLAASPDGNSLVVGTYGGRLIRYNSADLGGAQFLSNVLTGPVLALAISPDSTRLATSTAKAIATEAELPLTSSVVELRSLTFGPPIERLPEEADVVQALAFSPDGRRLVYSGGNSQAISIKELAPGSPPIPEEIKGVGSSLWDVGYRLDGRAIRFSRTRAPAPGQATDYEYFDLRGRFFFNPGPNEPGYRQAVASEDGWTIRPVDSFQLEFRNGNNPPIVRSLDQTIEGRWWAYTMIPPTPDHPQPVVAVATNSGQIVLWNLATGEKSRIFNGHLSRVSALASSSDGRWLLSGSSDQTVRLWSLIDCDKRPPFGVRFERRPDGPWVVVEVTPGGFAEGIGLLKNHVVQKVYEGAAVVDPSSFLPKLDAAVPGVSYTIEARLNGDPALPLLQGLTTKRDSPALSLFPGIDHRWVLWTPRGFYDSSADGDRKFLGWLTNRGTVAQLLAGTFDSIDKFEARFRQPKTRQPNVIDRLLDTANPIQAEAVALLPANPAQPPPADPVTSRLAALELAPVAPPAVDRPLVATQPTLPINYRVIAQAGSAGISRLWVEVNGRIVANLIAENAPVVREAQGRSEVPLGTDRNVRVSLVAIDERGVRRDQPLDLANQAPQVASLHKSRLEILGLAAEEFHDSRYPRIAYAEEDVTELARFLGEKLVDPATGTKFPTGQVHARMFLGDKLTKANLGETFGNIARTTDGEVYGPGDVVVVVVESHYLDFRSNRLLATTDPDLRQPDPPSISATNLADRLAELSRLGCRVVVLVDAVHEIKTPGWDLEIQEWVRQLQGQARVLTFIAADHGPSSPNGDGHRVFAQAILDVFKAKSAGRLRKPGATMSLFDFQRTVTDSVLQQTGRKQQAQCYLPDTMLFSIPFLDPSLR